MSSIIFPDKRHLTKESDEFGTPQWLFDALDSVYHFDLDVCANAQNAKCRRYFTVEDDALLQKWTGNCWMNPPYNRSIGNWVRYAKESAERRDCNVVVCLIPASTDVAWWHDYAIYGEICFLRGRIKFDGGATSARFANAIVTFWAGLPMRRRGFVQWGLQGGPINGK